MLTHKRRRLLLDDPFQDTVGGDDDDFILTDSNIGKHKTNFDLAIKMATDNKINSNNSWNYALIDYFHDMNLLRSQDGVSINFQKAGATLDGCMKIFSHRIDSVVSDTGRLLSGLAQRDSSSKGTEEGGKEDDDHVRPEDEDDESDLDEVGRLRKSKAKKKPRVYLKEGFDSLKFEEYDRKLGIDPLFKRALAEFDEGGAKSLLTNILKINSEGQIIFDEALTQSRSAENPVNPTVVDAEEALNEQGISKLAKLQAKVRSLLQVRSFDEKELSICSSIRELEGVLENIELAEDFVGNVFQAKEESNKSILPDIPNPLDAIDENDADGEVKDPTDGSGLASVVEDEGDIEDVNANVFELLHKLDKRTGNSWSGKSTGSWKINLFKKTIGKKMHEEILKEEKGRETETAVEAKKNIKGKKEFAIDFLADTPSDINEKMLFRHGRKNTWPESYFANRPSVTLPDDLQWNADRLVSSFLKPDKRISIFRRVKRRDNDESLLIEQDRWVDDYSKLEAAESDEKFFDDLPQQEVADEVAEDEGILGDIDFNMQLSSQNAQRNTAKPLNYARVSKKVDVRLLKENMWKSTICDERDDKIDVKLSDVVKSTVDRYEGTERNDISTSFFFICMLHLANEHGLEILGNEDHTDLVIKGTNSK
ncbi:DEKNAAC101737 [Brettanomyces naardenensis]|uniref:Condensin complex subunit 2 n=1 Tax=Brettanomyces naardenensis TaxID=13370 RepID=A0A448YIT9_BRENA|nr:DEKNAAC101737 [Brettanomyces naardenensis]